MGDYSWLIPMLDMTVECSLHRLEQNYYSDYGWNKNDDTRMVQTDRRGDREHRGRSSGQLSHPYPLLDRGQVLNLMPPTADDREFEHEVHDLKENLRLATDVEKVQPRKGLDKLLGIDAMCDRGPLHSAAGQSCPISVNAT